MELIKEKVELRKLIAAEGKTLANKEDNEIIGELIYLGKEDSADNYIEVDKPEIDKPEIE